ncbi:MAG: SusC/RagA family TonB-linked outer membrane protein, partial [Butyricimonas paravirosa]
MGISRIFLDYNLCNASEMLEVERRAGLYTDPNSQATADIDYNGRMQQILRGVDTYWLGKPLRNVFNHKHSLNLQGGEETIRYSLDLNYDSNNGVMKGSYRSRTGAGLTLDYRPKRWLQMMNSITYNRTSTEDSPYGAFSTYASMKPYLPIHDENGDLLQNLKAGSFTAVNPLYAVKYLGNYSG